MTPTNRAPELQLREEFNRWAVAGRGEEMEENHLPIVIPTLEMMSLRSYDRVLDVGCGSGWLVRRLAQLLPGGTFAGVDVSDEMVRRAQNAGATLPNATFLQGTAEDLTVPAESFSKVVSVESAYYWHNVGRGLGEIFRVLAPGGSAWILINYYRDNSDCHQWANNFEIPTTLLSAAEWQKQLETVGFREVQRHRVPDRSPTPETYSGRWFRDVAQLRSFKAQGALLITGVKPEKPEQA